MADKQRKTAIYALTTRGAETARKIKAGLRSSDLFLPSRIADHGAEEKQFEKLAAVLSENFNNYDGHIVAAAAGIVVRSLVSIIRDKTVDPAVVVVDQEGKFAISLLSGHLGGANELAAETARILGGQAVITTGTDIAGKPSLEVEAVRRGLKVENLKALSRISGDIIEGRAAPVYDPGLWFWPGLKHRPDSVRFLDNKPDLSDDSPLVWVGHEVMDFPDSWLLVRPPSLAVGMGCNRGTGVDEIEELLRRVLKEKSLALKSVGRLASIEVKKDEEGILELGRRLEIEPIFFRKEELNAVQTPNPSSTVKKHVGVESVCEAAAMLAARADRLLATKQKSRNATLAIAKINST